jgi:ferritin
MPNSFSIHKMTTRQIEGESVAKISTQLNDVINDQINYELSSGYIYLSMASWFETQHLDGMAHWMKIQAKEEYDHAMRFWNHVTERGGRVLLQAIESPHTEWTAPLDAWEVAYQHELNVTHRISKIGDLAHKENDKSAIPLLQWFYKEQIEEEEQTMKVLDLLTLIRDSTNALFMLDAKLGHREG